MYGPENVIGVPGAGNVISGNAYHGVVLYDGGAARNVVQANRIGTRADGASAARNTYYGIQVHNAFGNLIGGWFFEQTLNLTAGDNVSRECADNRGRFVPQL